MKRIKLIFRFLSIVLIVFMVANGCKDKYQYIDYDKLEADELKLLERFYESDLFKDSLLNIKKFNVKEDSIFDLRESDKLFMVKTYTFPITDPDTIKIGQTVGFRYTFMALTKDENDSLIIYDWFNNKNFFEPEIYSVGNFSTTNATVCYGIDLAIRKMFLYDKCRLVIPSSIGAQTMLRNFSVYDQFTTIIADIEVTYVSRY